MEVTVESIGSAMSSMDELEQTLTLERPLRQCGNELKASLERHARVFLSNSSQTHLPPLGHLENYPRKLTYIANQPIATVANSDTDTPHASAFRTFVEQQIALVDEDNESFQLMGLLNSRSLLTSKVTRIAKPCYKRRT